MMADLVYWFPFGASVVLGLLVAVINKRVAELHEAAAKFETIEGRVETMIAVMDQRSTDFAEAIELLNYGAKDEAIELFKRYGVRVRVHGSE